jgi:hypothetical protein
MPASIDVQSTEVVHKCASWKVLTKNVAIARGVTDDGRTVEGIGESRWSGESALDAAVENLKENAATTDFSFRIAVLEGGTPNVRIEFVDEQGSTRKQGSMRGLTNRKTVKIEASNDGRTVNSEATEGLINVGFRNRGPSWADKLDDAVEKAEKQFDRVGTTTVEG